MSKIHVVNPALNAFFEDIDASSVISLKMNQVTAPMIIGTPLTIEELSMGGGVRIVMHVIDRSPSMIPVRDLLLTDFNTEYKPAIQAAREDDISALRMGGLSFSTDITQIWKLGNDYFHSLDKLPALTKAEYYPMDEDDTGYVPRLHGGTSLNAAIIEAYAIAAKYACVLLQERGIIADIDILVLSDGANNQPPDSSQVRQVIGGSKKGIVRFIAFYFETSSGMRDPKGYFVKELGFDSEYIEVFAQKLNETPKERASRFRRMVRVMSKVSASKHATAVKASAAVQQEDDLV